MSIKPNKKSEKSMLVLTTMRVMFFILICKAINAGKEIAVSYYYGVSDLVDAYQFALTITTFIPAAIVSSFILAGIPLLANIYQSSNAQQRELLFKEIQTRMLLAGLLISFLILSSYSWIINNTNTAQQNSHFTEYANHFFKVFCLLPPLILLTALGITRLRLQHKHADSLTEAIISITVIIFLTSNFQSISLITPLLWGTSIGFILHFILIQIQSTYADGIKGLISTSIKAQSPYLKTLLNGLSVIFLSQLLIALNQPIDQYAASSLSNNSISILGYTNRLLSLIISLGALAITRVALPIFCEPEMQLNKERLVKIAVKSTVLLLIAGLLITITIWQLAPWGVAILFEYGEFTSKNTLEVTEALRWGLLQLPFHFSALLLIQIFASQNRQPLIFYVVYCGMVIKIGTLYLFLPHLQLKGIMLSTCCMYIFIFAAFFISLKLKKQKNLIK